MQNDFCNTIASKADPAGNCEHPHAIAEFSVFRNLGTGREHLGAVVATMKLSADWHDFRAKLDKHYPRQGKPTQLSFDYSGDDAEDDGKGL